MAYRIEKTDTGNDIVIDGFENGIADSPYDGISDMRNVNIISIPGEVSVNYQTSAAQQTPITAAAYTVNDTNETFTYSGTALKDGTAIVITVSTGSVGITSGNTYWVKNATATTFTVSATVDSLGAPGANVNVTSAGTGTFTTVNLGAMTQIVPYGVNSFSYSGIGTGANPSSAFFYGVDSNGRAWVFISSTPNWVYLGNTMLSSSPPKPNGIAFWNNYILVFRSGGTAIDYLQFGFTSASWVYGWKSGTSSLPARTFTDVNGNLYWCNGTSIGSLIELTAFDPTSAATYTYTASALLINDLDAAVCIEQLGNVLLIGGGRNVVYMWDKNPLNAGNSSGYTPLLLPEQSVTRMVTVNSNTYIFAGNRGRIYITNGANVELYKKMPDHLSGTVEPYYQWGGAIYSKNQLYFGVAAKSSADGTALPYYGGLWAISTDTNSLRLVNRQSFGTYAGFITELAQSFSSSTAAGVSIGGTSILSTWYDGVSLYGSDYSATTQTPYTNYESYVDSDLIPIGTYLKPNTNGNVEFKLTVPMVAGEGVKLAYRQKLSDSFTDITSGEFTTAGTYSGVVKVSFQKSQWLQIRCYTKSTATTPSYTRLRELRIR